MRRVIGKQVVELTQGEFDELLSRHRGAILDVGTGDGKHAYHLARQRPDCLVVGLDAVRDNMRRTAAKAAANPAKGGADNLLYVWASAERLPAELHGFTGLHVLMPWGSLLRGVLGDDPAMLRGLARVCTGNARFLIALNLHAWRPPVPEVGGHPEPTPQSAVRELGPIFSAAGWRLDEARYLDAGEVAELATSWTRRLRSSREQFDVLAVTGLVNPGQPVNPGRPAG